MAGSRCTWIQSLQMVARREHTPCLKNPVGLVCWFPIGRRTVVSTNERRRLKAGESGSPGWTKAYCSGFCPYLLNNWSIVENNSLYEIVPGGGRGDREKLLKAVADDACSVQPKSVAGSGQQDRFRFHGRIFEIANGLFFSCLGRTFSWFLLVVLKSLVLQIWVKLRLLVYVFFLKKSKIHETCR